jgi:hypothetical protein
VAAAAAIKAARAEAIEAAAPQQRKALPGKSAESSGKSATIKKMKQSDARGGIW